MLEQYTQPQKDSFYQLYRKSPCSFVKFEFDNSILVAVDEGELLLITPEGSIVKYKG